MLVKTTTTDIDTVTAAQQLCKGCRSLVDTISLDPVTGLCPVCLKEKKDSENVTNSQPQV